MGVSGDDCDWRVDFCWFVCVGFLFLRIFFFFSSNGGVKVIKWFEVWVSVGVGDF